MTSRIKLQGKWYDRIPYDDEDCYDCHDCGCNKGEYHELGCDMEECPVCITIEGNMGQLIGCGCWDEDTIVEECDESTEVNEYALYLAKR